MTMRFIPSSASELDVDVYTRGESATFALALHRMFGWAIHVKLGDGVFCEMPDGSEMPEVIHVVAVSPDGMAWDVRGARPERALQRELASLFMGDVAGTDICGAESELRHYCGCWAEPGQDTIERPLFEMLEADIEEASRVAVSVLSDLPGFPSLVRTPAFA